MPDRCKFLYSVIFSFKKISVWFLNYHIFFVHFRQKKSGRKKIRRENSKLHREIQKLKSLLHKHRKKVDKLKKKLKRRESKNQQVSDSPASKTRQQLQNVRVSPDVRRSLLAHNALMANIKDTFTNTKRRADRQVMLQLVTGNILKKYGLQGEMSRALQLSRKRRVSSCLGGKKVKYQSLCFRLQEKVTAFMTRDENSRLTAGKSQTITRNKIKKQKRFLNDTLRNLHRKFLIEHPHC